MFVVDVSSFLLFDGIFVFVVVCTGVCMSVDEGIGVESVGISVDDGVGVESVGISVEDGVGVERLFCLCSLL